MSDDLAVFLPAYRDEASKHGLFSAFEPGTRTLPAGFQVGPLWQPLPIDIVFEKDVAVTLRDGVTIYTDIFRPAGSDPVPVLVAWSPYGKSRGNAPQYVELFALLGMDTHDLSGLHKFEGPDPAYWCAQGYAVCNPDPRGCYHSKGDIRHWSQAEGEDCHDLIEWLGVQPWCNGKVGMTGNSYLAISQWFAAAEQPPHLAAIAPWEGMSDIYRDFVARGGIPDLSFPARLGTSLVGNQGREDFVLEAEAHPLLDDLWRSKIPAFDRVTVPAFVVASYSNSIHTPGTFRGWRSIAATDKWLRIHNTMEWPDYYEEANLADLRRFFDRYLKDEANGWEETPTVRYALMDLTGGDRLLLPAEAFPPADFATTKLFLDAGAGGLATTEPAAAATATYDATAADGQAVFTLRADRALAIAGYPKARLWVAADGADDLDVFVFLQKLAADGTLLEQFTIPNHGPAVHEVTRAGASILKYKGSNGRLRASLRHLDPDRSTDDIPVHTFDRSEKLTPGEPVAIDIDLFPVGLLVRAGEHLRFVVSATNILGGAMPGMDNVPNTNTGRHVVHTGGAMASYLQVPMRPLVD